MRPFARVSLAGLAAFGVFSSGCSGQPSSFSHTVDPALTPAAESITDSSGSVRPLARFADETGVATDFVIDELLVSGETDAELAGLLARYQGTLVRDKGAGQRRHTLVRIQQPLSDVSHLDAHADGLGMKGAAAFSSPEAVRLIATAMAEDTAGLHVSPNFVAYGAAGKMVRSTQEAAGWAFTSSFNDPSFNREKGTVNKNGATVVGAWQYLEWVGYQPRSVRVAIIDGGFWLDGNGVPMSSAIGTDLPSAVVQENIDTGTSKAGGANLAKCTGGATCNWHGNGSAGVATGLMNNSAGAVGTGGQVADPILVNIDMTDGEVVDALELLDLAPGYYGTQVINMSFGGDCNSLCRYWRENHSSFYNMFAATINAGRIVVAAAGNDAGNADTTEPCRLPGVICVGALNDQDNTAKTYSNSGSAVTIWAPTDIFAMPDGNDATQFVIHSGTSAAAPYVAGVVAMMRAVNPSLSPADAKSILQTTANKGPLVTPDPKVQGAGYLDARAAVMQAGGYLPPDALEPNETWGTAQSISTGDYNGLTVGKSDQDHFRIHLSDYGRIDVTLDDMWEGLGRLTPVPIARSGQGNFWNETAKYTSTGYQYGFGGAAPGDYEIYVAGGIQPYNLHVTVDVYGLKPDFFEVNDAFASPFSKLAFGSNVANFHANGDVDYYRYTVKGTPNSDYYFLWQIDWSDVDLVVDVLDGSGTVLHTQTGRSQRFTWDYTQNGTVFYIRVSGSYGRYAFTDGPQKFPSAIPPFIVQQLLPFLDPSDPDPFNGMLSENDGWVGFVAGGSPVGLPSATGLSLAAEGLHVSLVDGTGATVTDGVALPADPASGGSTGEDLAFPATLASGASYYLHLTRTDQAASLPDGTAVRLPVLSYTLGFTR